MVTSWRGTPLLLDIVHVMELARLPELELTVKRASGATTVGVTCIMTPFESAH